MPGNPFYSSPKWRKLRRKVLMDAGLPVKGTHVHHRYALADHPGLALDRRNLAPMTQAEHNREHARERNPQRQGCDIDGTPRSPLHPWSQGERVT